MQDQAANIDQDGFTKVTTKSKGKSRNTNSPPGSVLSRSPKTPPKPKETDVLKTASKDSSHDLSLIHI